MEKFLEFLKSLTEKRKTKALRTEYGKYTSRDRVVEYSDKEKEYLEPAEIGKDHTTVHSTKAFTDYIAEEFKRRNNNTGKFATVQLGINESSFCANDDFNSGCCTYNRIASEQLKQLQNFNGKTLNQEALIEMILRLKPSLINYGLVLNAPEVEGEYDINQAINSPDFATEVKAKEYYNGVFSTYSKLKISRNAQMNMNPVFNADGESDNSYTCNFRLITGNNAGTDEEVKIPEGFNIAVPFVKAGNYYCNFYVDIQPLNDNGNVCFAVKVPNYETEIESAIIHESEVIKNNLEQYPELLVLADL